MMRSDELKRLKARLEIIRKANQPIYLQLKDCTYKVIGAGTLEEVDRIPNNAVVENVNCDKEHFVFLFVVDGKPYYCNIISATEAKEQGIL